MSRFLKTAARNEYAQTALAYAVVLCVAFSDVVFGGRTLLTSPYMASAMPQGPYGYPERPLLEKIDGFPRYDPASSAWLTEPNAVLTHNLYASGQLPLWNPYVGAGQPLAADLFSGVFFPLKFLLYIWPDPITWDIFYLLRLLIAGTLAYAYMRKIEVSRLGSFGAGLAFMLNGYFISFMNMPHLNVEVLLPALLLGCEKALRGERRSGMTLGIISVALSMLGGNPEATFFALMLMSLYYFWRTVSPLEGESRSAYRLDEIRSYFLMVVPGMALSAFVVLPFLELVFLGAHAHGTHAGVTVTYPPITAMTFLIPEFFGRTGTFWLRNIQMWAPAMGVTPLMIALAGVPADRGKRKICYFFGIYFILYLLKAYGAPVINWVGYLPILNQCFINKYGFPLAAFGVAVCAGLAIENIRKGERIRWALVLSALAGLFLLLGFYFCYFSLLDLGRFRELVVPGVTREETLRSMAVMSAPSAALALAVAAFALALRREFIRPALGAGLVVLLLFLETKLYLVRLENPARYDPFTKAPYIEFLQREAEPVRFVGLQLTLPPATSAAFGLYDLRNFNAVEVKRNANLVKTFFNPDTEKVPSMLRNSGERADILDLCNVKYVLSPTYLRGLGERLVYDREVKIYLNPDYLPRAFLADRAVAVSSTREALQLLGSDSIDLGSAVVLEKAGVEGGGVGEFAHRTGPPGEAVIEEYRANSVRIRTRAASESFLVLLDTFYPGWKATVDGVPTEIMPAYSLFRAIRVPSGEHEVVFKYSPRSYKIGLVISLLGLLGAVWAARSARAGNVNETGSA